eukprot:5632001-Pyramimonas_sp.AAC.1
MATEICQFYPILAFMFFLLWVGYHATNCDPGSPPGPGTCGPNLAARRTTNVDMARRARRDCASHALKR